MSYFGIGVTLAIIVGTVLLALPFIPSIRGKLAETFSDTVLGDCFDGFDDPESSLEDILVSTFVGTLLWLLFTGTIWFLILLLWPLLAPALVLMIVAWRKYKKQS